MLIKKYETKYLEEIKNLHEQTVRHICSKDYSEDQIRTWPGLKDGYVKIDESLKNSNSFVAVIDEKIVGFGDINKNGHLHRIYTHKDHQGKGTATTILKKLEAIAKQKNIKKIKLVSTITAKTFYEKYGYKTIAKKEGYIDEVLHEDYEMEKEMLK